MMVADYFTKLPARVAIQEAKGRDNECDTPTLTINL